MKVSADVSKIVDELSNRNQTITRYLNRSEESYILAWGAIILTFVLAVIQIFQNKISSKKLKDYLDDSEKTHNKKLDIIEEKIKNKE